MNIKERFTKCKEWVKEHKGIVIGAGISVLTAVGLAALVKSNKSTDDEYSWGDGTEPDYGRDCTMKFVVNDTQEVLGEVPCTELYAKEELEIQQNYMNN